MTVGVRRTGARGFHQGQEANGFHQQAGYITATVLAIAREVSLATEGQTIHLWGVTPVLAQVALIVAFLELEAFANVARVVLVESSGRTISPVFKVLSGQP